jgi:predicted Zn-dependent protease
VYVTDKQPVGTIEERWMQWFEIASNLGAAQNDLTVVLLEDHPDNIDTFNFEQEGMIGLASGIGVLGARPSALLAKVMGGEKFMTRVLIHEIGHVLGAEHVDEGIMHPCACVNQYSDEYSHYSLAQIKAHLDLVRKYRASRPKVSTQALVMNKEAAVFESSALMCI